MAHSSKSTEVGCMGCFGRSFQSAFSSSSSKTAGSGNNKHSRSESHQVSAGGGAVEESFTSQTSSDTSAGTNGKVKDVISDSRSKTRRTRGLDNASSPHASSPHASSPRYMDEEWFRKDYERAVDLMNFVRRHGTMSQLEADFITEVLQRFNRLLDTRGRNEAKRSIDVRRSRSSVDGLATQPSYNPGEMDYQLQRFIKVRDDGTSESTTPHEQRLERFRKLVHAVSFSLRARKAARNRKAASASEPQSEEVANLLRFINSWHDFNVFALSTVSGGNELELTATAVFHEHNLFEIFSLDVTKTVNYFHAVSKHYRKNPYHNSVHATDVLQSTHVLITSGLGEFLSDLEKLAVLLAAMVHDIGHLGYNNPFLVDTKHDLALRYNDQSVNEHYHACLAFQIMHEDPSCDLTSSLTENQSKMLRKIVVDIVLKTDMAVHFTMLNSFTEYLDNYGANVEEWDEEGRTLARAMIVHTADLTNVSRPTHLATQWGTRVVDEMWRQGDEEKRIGKALSPLCDRETTSVASAQVGFSNFIVKPLLEQVGRVMDVGFLNSGVDAYVAHYEAELAKEQATDKK